MLLPRLALALLIPLATISPAQAQVEPGDPACQDPTFMAGALEAIKQKLDTMLDKTETSRRMVAAGLSEATLENPEAVTKSPGILGCNYDLVLPPDRIRMFAKQTTEGTNVTWLALPAL